jgi:nucleotide-binding universal stress UspA family protein
MAIRTILVPTDFSSHSSRAFDQAIELAKSLSAKLVLLHCYWVNLSVGPEDLWTLPSDSLDRLHDGASAALEQWTKRAEQAGVPCQSQLRRDKTVPTILELAASLPADLTVMGTHGHSDMEHVSLGGATERVVRLAHCPVLSIKAEAEAA